MPLPYQLSYPIISSLFLTLYFVRPIEINKFLAGACMITECWETYL